MKTGFLVLAFLLISATAMSQDEKCLTCHSETGVPSHPGAQAVDPTIINSSVHSSLLCVDCHDVDPDKSHADNLTVFCGRCHQGESESYNQSPHMVGKEAGIEEVPGCVSCHGGHDILAIDDPDSRTFHKNSVAICVVCHTDRGLTDQVAEMPDAAMIAAYENSIHGRALLQDGNMDAPACVDCHGSHTFYPSDKPDSPLYKNHIAGTCGKCHSDIATTYEESVHGMMLTSGVQESPTCTNCHGEHSIRPHSDPESQVYATNVSTTCSDCHASEKIIARFGLKADRIATFKESFHGVVAAFGDTTAANCASCHGVHNIFPQSDPRSLIHADNIINTCGECHDDLPESFARGTVHVSASDPESGGPFYVRSFYIWFISLLIIGFVIYRVLE
jgi:hypothetical protein